MTMEPVGAIAGSVGVSHIVDAVRDGGQSQTKLLEDILTSLQAANKFAEVQLQRPVYPLDLSPSAGVTDGIGRVTEIEGRRRAVGLLVSGANLVDRFAFRQGGATLFEFRLPSIAPKWIPLPIIVQGQVSIRDLTTGTDSEWRAYLFAHADADIISYQRPYGG